MKFLKYILFVAFLALLSCNFRLEKEQELISIKTNLGTMRFILFEQTPKHNWWGTNKNIYMKEGGFPSLDGEYTVFGMLVDGFDILEKISTSPTDKFKRPVEDVTIQITLEKLPKSKITELYGYKFENLD